MRQVLYALVVTHSICSACIAKVDAQIAAVACVQITFPCPSCPREAAPYKVTWHEERCTIYVRCPGCDLTWIEEATADTREPPTPPECKL